MSKLVLIVDDDLNILSGVNRHLGNKFDIHTASSGQEALEKISKTMYAAVLCDQHMPNMSGIEVLEKIAEISPDTVKMMLTGNADQKTAVDAINKGQIFRFYNKPTKIEVLYEGIDAALKQYQLIIAERELLEQTLTGSIRLLNDLLLVVSPENYSKSLRVQSWISTVLKHIKIKDDWMLIMAAELFKIGTITGPNQTVDEVAKNSANLIRKIPRMEPIANIIENEHVWYNKKQNMSMASKIFNILVALDEVGVGYPSKESFDELEKQVGRFDHELLQKIKNCLVNFNTDVTEVIMNVKISELKICDKLLSDIVFAKDSRLVLSSGEKLSETLIARIASIHKMKQLEEPIKIKRIL